MPSWLRSSIRGGHRRGDVSSSGTVFRGRARRRPSAPCSGAWEPWCAGQYVADPERLFADPAYLTEVATRAVAPRFGPTLSRAGRPAAMWSLLVAEDCDEFLRASARRDAGAALGRLLNLADRQDGRGGEVGQHL